MERIVLVVDDNHDELFLEQLKNRLEEEINHDSPIVEKVVIHYYNPLDALDETDVDGLFNDMAEKHFSGRLDLVLCDFNLYDQEKLLAYEIVVKVREYNKNCEIILFTGNPLKELIRLEHDGLSDYLEENLVVAEGGTVDKDAIRKHLDDYIKQEVRDFSPLEKASCSNIRAFVDRRRVADAAVDGLLNPSIGMRIEAMLFQYSTLTLNGGVPDLDGILLSEIATAVRVRSLLGVKFKRQLLEAGFTLLLDQDGQ